MKVGIAWEELNPEKLEELNSEKLYIERYMDQPTSTLLACK
jgi:hypothetical protein